MKSIGLSEEVYKLLLEQKHIFEKDKEEVMGFDKVIRLLIEGGEERNGSNQNRS